MVNKKDHSHYSKQSNADIILDTVKLMKDLVIEDPDMNSDRKQRFLFLYIFFHSHLMALVNEEKRKKSAFQKFLDFFQSFSFKS
ncbi:MAG: hypothetical protein ACK5KT_15000 [Dysgonomonas sp.]